MRVLPEGVAPELARVQGTDAAEIGVFADGATGTTIVICALDNLGKGAAGQAVQNANLALGLDETAGLRLHRGARMSVTAAAGLRRRRACTRRSAARRTTSRSSARCRPATGAAMWTQNRVLRPRRSSSRSEHLALAQPQAVVDQLRRRERRDRRAGRGRRARDRRARRSAARPRAGAGARALDRRDRRAAADRPHARRASTPRPQRSRADGGDDAAEAILTTDTKPKTAVAHGAGFTVGGMAKGSGMIHPNLATMLAVVTTDYPLEPGEAIEFLRPAVDVELQLDHRRRRVLDERRGRAALVRRRRRSSARRRPTRLSRSRCARVCRDLSQQIVADGEGATLARRDQRHRRRERRPRRSAIAQRIATSPLVKTALFGRDANWGRVLMAAGSAPFNGGYAQRRPDARLALLQRHGGARRRRAAERRAAGRRRASARSTSTSASATAQRGYLTSDLSYDYVRINAEYRS